MSPKTEIVIEIRQDDGEAWRVYSQGDSRPLSEGGVVLGGSWDMAMAAALRLEKEDGFTFIRPGAVWLPSEGPIQ